MYMKKHQRKSRRTKFWSVRARFAVCTVLQLCTRVTWECTRFWPIRSPSFFLVHYHSCYFYYHWQGWWLVLGLRALRPSIPSLLQRVTVCLFFFFFTKWSLHRATTFLLQSACREATTSITKWDDYCKVPQNKSAFLFHVDVDTATKDKKKTCLQRQCLQMKASTDQEDIKI